MNLIFKESRRVFFVVMWMISIFFLSGTSSHAQKPKVGDEFPNLQLEAPTDAAHLQYLSLAPEKSFNLLELDAEIIIIEIFSMYCPHCQKDAPAVNRLFKRINEDKKLKNKVKLIGIGIGNSKFEVDVFRKKYDVKFPMFTDTDFTIHKQIGEVLTPFFIGIRKVSKGDNRIFFSHLSGIKDQDAFIKTLKKQLAN